MSELADDRIVHALRELAPRVLGAIIRRYGDFAAAEDAVQEALVAAAVQWPREGMPDKPVAWLTHVAARRMTDHLRSEASRREREAVASAEISAVAGPLEGEAEDDTLVLMLMCCHPSLTNASAIALTLRAVGGLTTAEIARAFLVPEPTMAQRISRAKQTIRASAVPFSLPEPGERNARIDAVLHILYLIFNEGYASSEGDELIRPDLSREAIRLARAIHVQLPDSAEVAGLLSLMLLTDARRAARTGPHGELIPLTEQDRALWDRAMIEEGVDLVAKSLSRGTVGPYQLQAAIAALHDEAAHAGDTDWAQILALYGLLERMSDNPMVTLNRAIALAMVHGPRHGLDLLATLDRDDRVSGHHRLAATRAHLLEVAGETGAAMEWYRRAADRTASIPERNYLHARAARLLDPA